MEVPTDLVRAPALPASSNKKQTNAIDNGRASKRAKQRVEEPYSEELKALFAQRLRDAGNSGLGKLIELLQSRTELMDSTPHNSRE